MLILEILTQYLYYYLLFEVFNTWAFIQKKTQSIVFIIHGLLQYKH